MPTSEPSTEHPSPEPSIYSQAGFLANHSVLPGTAEAIRMTVTSGQRWFGLLANAGPAGCLVRTLLASSAWVSTMCLMTWNVSTTKRGRLLFRLRAWELPISERESGLLPTLNATRAANDMTLTKSGDGRMKPNKLGWAVAQMLPTPNASDAIKDRVNASQMRRHSPSLYALWSNRLWPTPTAQMGKHGAPTEWEMRNRPEHLHVRAAMWTTPTADDTGHRQSRYAQGGTALSTQAGMRLPPTFVEEMMGYPEGWTDIG